MEDKFDIILRWIFRGAVIAVAALMMLHVVGQAAIWAWRSL